MGQLAVGTVVVIKFPFSNLKGIKFRPALVIAQAEFDNLILCQITSKPYSSRNAVTLEQTNFADGKLSLTSYIRPDKIFTADQSIVKSTVGHLDANTIARVQKKVRALF